MGDLLEFGREKRWRKRERAQREIIQAATDRRYGVPRTIGEVFDPIRNAFYFGWLAAWQERYPMPNRIKAILYAQPSDPFKETSINDYYTIEEA